ncbi:MAG: hypothetical protein ACI9XU_001849, partial [Arenicella sp.]
MKLTVVSRQKKRPFVTRLTNGPLNINPSTRDS